MKFMPPEKNFFLIYRHPSHQFSVVFFGGGALGEEEDFSKLRMWSKMTA